MQRGGVLLRCTAAGPHTHTHDAPARHAQRRGNRRRVSDIRPSLVGPFHSKERASEQRASSPFSCLSALTLRRLPPSAYQPEMEKLFSSYVRLSVRLSACLSDSFVIVRRRRASILLHAHSERGARADIFDWCPLSPCSPFLAALSRDTISRHHHCHHIHIVSLMFRPSILPPPSTRVHAQAHAHARAVLRYPLFVCTYVHTYPQASIEPQRRSLASSRPCSRSVWAPPGHVNYLQAIY